MDNNSFLFQACIYLAAAVVMVPIAKKLGLGSVLGYLLAGIIIGPAALGLIGKGQDIMHFAEFGVVMMLFIIGLELEPALLWKLRKAIVGLGGLQVLVTAIVIAGIALLFKMPWQSAIALGMTLSLSSTAIVLQTLNEKGLIKTAGGQSSFAVLLFQDIAVIPMLALFPLLSIFTPQAVSDDHGDKTWVSAMPGWLHALVVFGVIVSIIVAGLFLIRPLFRLIAKTGLREIFTATSLLLVAGIAVLMTQVGLSPALGTFVAGVVLANSEYKHELESDIDPFKGLLLGLFFIAVGASVDFNLIMTQPGLIFGIVLALMAVKGIVLFVLGKSFKLSLDQNLLFSFGLCQVGEFAFVLFSFSLQEGVLEKGTTDIMIAVVAISMALTPLVMLINEKLILPRFGVKEEEEKEPDEIDEQNPVIIAGFGHFGSTVGRFLRANGVQATFLDINSDQVDLLRKYGFKVFFGDATRADLLRAAGAEKAKLIVISIGSAERRLEMIETIKKHFPNLRMFVRASNRYDAYDQMNAGMLHVYRETIDTSLRMGRDVLGILGFRAYQVQRASNMFFKYDERNLKELAALKLDSEEYALTIKGFIEEQERLLQADKSTGLINIDLGWDEESLIADANLNT
jgi:CPA2 family monovalent cation:H+ antiporter-2